MTLMKRMMIEQLFETSNEIEDLHYLAGYIIRFIKLASPNGKYNISKIKDILNEPLNIYSSSVQSMLEKLTFNFREIKSNALGGFYPGINVLILDFKKIKKSKRFDIGLVLSHELQHALDYSKSKYSFTDEDDFDISNYDDYLRYKEEINARFTEVLLLIARQHPTKANLPSIINSAFKQRQIFRDLYDKGPKGQRKYNQLKKRAYKFYDEFIQINSRQPKQTLFATVKNLILRFTLFK